MPLVLADRVNETTTTTSTGTLTLAGAVSGYQSFAVIGNGNTTYYTIVHQTANEWEVGIGTYTSSGTTLARNTVLASSNSGSLVNFSAGTKFVFCDYPAGRAVYLDTATNVTIPGLTLSGGTANGVLYLNGSKVATSGSALTFNGTTLVSPDITDSSLTSGRVTYAGTGGNFVDSANLTFNGTTLVAADLTDSSLTSGRVVFSGAGGNLSDSSSLTWNGTGLGVGTSSAGVQLDVRSSIGSTPGFNNNVARFLSTATAAVGVGGAIVLGGKTNNLTADYAFAGLQGVKESATASNYAGSLLFLTQNSVGSTSLSEHMRLLSTGDFGIGTAAPNYKLDVRGTIATGNGTVRMALSSTAADGITGTLSNHGLFFYTNNTARGYFDTSGNLGLGTTTSRGDLDVSSGATTTAITKSVHLGYSSANFYGFRLANTNTAGSFFAGTFSIQRGTGAAWSDDFAVNNSGNVGIGTTSPTNTAGFSRQLQIEGTTAALTLSGTTGTGKYTLGVPGANAVGLWDNTASAYRWYVDSSGNVGIGLTNPVFYSGRLTVDGGNIALASAGRSLFWNAGGTGVAAIQGVGTDALAFQTSNSFTERMRLDSSGNLGIGTTTNALTNALTVYRTGSTQAALAAGNSNTGLNGTLFGVDTAGNGIVNQTQVLPLIFSTSNTERMRLDSSGQLGLGVTPRAWAGGYKSLDITGPGAIASTASGDTFTQVANGAWFNGTNWIYQYTGIGAARYQMTGPSGGGSHAWFVAPTGTAGNAISFTQAMTLDASGNLGIGTASPAEALEISRTTDPKIRFVDVGNLDAKIGIVGSTALGFEVNGSERARITSGGELLVGTTSTTPNPGVGIFPSGFLSVGNNAGSSGFVFQYFVRSATTIGTISQNGTTAVLYNTTSDARLKENIAPAPEAGEKIDAIQIVSHDWKSAPDERVEYGVIAQDLHGIAPQAVNAGDNGEEVERAWGVDYSKLVPMLVKEVQSLRARLAAAGL